MSDALTEMLRGTLEGCVLQLIDAEETYGYAVTRRLNELGFGEVTEGTVYTILLRLEKRMLVDVSKRPSGLGPPRKLYTLNDAGLRELATFWTKWDYLSSRIEELRSVEHEPLGADHGERPDQGLAGLRDPRSGTAR